MALIDKIRSGRHVVQAMLAFAVVLSVSPVFAQSSVPVAPMAADAHPSFAVATIKPHDPASRHQGFETAGDRFSMFDESVSMMMAYAYSINRSQIVNGPEWIGESRFDVVGKPDLPGEPSLHQQQVMIQKLLTDRFGLKFHIEQQEMPVYAIRLTKGGSKLAPAADPTAKPDEHAAGHGLWTTRTYTSTSMADFILIEQFFVNRPLVDQTGLTGRYDFKLNYTYNEIQNTDPNAPPGLFTAVQEQLGLKFQPTKAPVEVYVIDNIEKPSDN